MALPTLWRSAAKSTKVVLTALVAVSLTVLLTKLLTRDPLSDTPLRAIVIPYIQLVPRYAIRYPWVLATSIFAEVSYILFVMSAAVLFVATGYLEKFWGFREVLKFIAVVGCLTNLSTVIVTIVSNIFRGDVKGMEKPLGGGILYFFGFLVVLKQLIPEHNVVLFQGLVNFRVKHLPFVSLAAVIAWLSLTRSLYPALPSVMSFLVLYNYLRFHQLFFSDPLLPITGSAGETSANVIHGDASDAFQLVEFFPSVSKPYVGPLINVVYDLSVLLGVVTPFNDDAIEQSNERNHKLLEQVKNATRQISNLVAERRRQVALQVIEDRANLN